MTKLDLSAVYGAYETYASSMRNGDPADIIVQLITDLMHLADTFNLEYDDEGPVGGKELVAEAISKYTEQGKGGTMVFLGEN